VVPGVVCSWFLLFTATIAVVRQKFHLSSCSDFRDRLYTAIWPNLLDKAERPKPSQFGSNGATSCQQVLIFAVRYEASTMKRNWAIACSLIFNGDGKSNLRPCACANGPGATNPGTGAVLPMTGTIALLRDWN
jgi:hypothetical protein